MEPKDNRLAYQGKVEAHLKEWGSQIDEWKDKAGAESQEFLEDLNTKRQAVRSKLAEIKDAADDRWEAFKVDVDQAVDDMQQAVENMRDRIR
jgi:malate synthase